MTIVGLVSLEYFQKAVETSDFDYNGALAFMWAKIEVTVGITCASIPMLKPLVAQYIPGWLGVSRVSYAPEFERNTETIQLSTRSPKSKPTKHSTLWESVRLYSLRSYDDIHDENPKPDLETMWKRSLKPLFFATILFILWGLAYGLFGVLTGQFSNVYSLSDNQLLGLHSAYFT